MKSGAFDFIEKDVLSERLVPTVSRAIDEDRRLREMRQHCKDIRSRRATLTHLTAMFAAMHAHRTAVRAVNEAAGGHPRVYAEWQRRVVDHFIDETTAFIRRQVEAGRSRVEDPRRLASALILMNNAVAHDNLMRDRPDPPEVVARIVGGIWNDAIYGPRPAGGSTDRGAAPGRA